MFCRGRFYHGGGDNLLGYSLPWRNFRWEVLRCDTGSGMQYRWPYKERITSTFLGKWPLVQFLGVVGSEADKQWCARRNMNVWCWSCTLRGCARMSTREFKTLEYPFPFSSKWQASLKVRACVSLFYEKRQILLFKGPTQWWIHSMMRWQEKNALLNLKHVP